MIFIQRTTHTVHYYASRSVGTHIDLVPYTVFIFILAVRTPADREAQSHIEALHLIRDQILIRVRHFGVTRRQIIHRQGHVHTVVRHKAQTGTDVTVLTVVDERVAGSDVKPVHRTESNTERQLFVQTGIVQTGSRNDTKTNAVIPEISINTDVQTSGNHASKAFLAVTGEPDAVEQVLEVVSDSVAEDVGGELTVRVFVFRISVVDSTGSVKDCIDRAVVFAGFGPVDESEIHDSSADLQVLNRLVRETEVDCGTVTHRLEHAGDIIVIHQTVSIEGLVIESVNDLLHILAIYVTGEIIHIHRSSYVQVHIAFEVPLRGSSIDMEILTVQVRVVITQQEFQLTTDCPLVIELMTITGCNFHVCCSVET